MPDEVTDMSALRAIVDERHTFVLRELDKGADSLARFGERIGRLEESESKIESKVDSFDVRLGAIERNLDDLSPKIDSLFSFVTSIRDKFTLRWIGGLFAVLTGAITLAIRFADIFSRIH